MEAIQRRFPHPQNYLVGYSLGGNFALRTGAAAAGRGYTFKKIVAVCPVISPPHVMANLERSTIYHRHFVRLWSDSLLNKLQYFPELGYGEALPELKSLSAMNDYFVPNHTPFDDTSAYLAAYGVTGDTMSPLRIPTHILASADDPVVLTEDIALAAKPEALTVEITARGGHCGFLKNYRLDSWADQRVAEILAAH
jgi:predicted alpha/beta-fold hydrolase